MRRVALQTIDRVGIDEMDLFWTSLTVFSVVSGKTVFFISFSTRPRRARSRPSVELSCRPQAARRGDLNRRGAPSVPRSASTVASYSAPPAIASLRIRTVYHPEITFLSSASTPKRHRKNAQNGLPMAKFSSGLRPEPRRGLPPRTPPGAPPQTPAGARAPDPAGPDPILDAHTRRLHDLVPTPGGCCSLRLVI